MKPYLAEIVPEAVPFQNKGRAQDDSWLCAMGSGVGDASESFRRQCRRLPPRGELCWRVLLASLRGSIRLRGGGQRAPLAGSRRRCAQDDKL